MQEEQQQQQQQAAMVKMGKNKHAIAPAPSAPRRAGAASQLDLYTFEQDDDGDGDSAAACAGQFGNSKMYADEASLYSIAEDSREDAISTIVGQTQEGVLMSTAAETGSGEQHPGEFGVELSLDMEEPTAAMMKGDADDDSAAKFYDVDRRRRRRFIATTAILICLVLSLVAIAVSVTETQEDSSRSTISEGVLSGETGEEPPDPTDAPTFADTTRIQAETLVVLAIGDCPGPGSYFEETTLQGQVFQALIDEVVAKATFDPTTGDVTFDERHGIDYLQEKYALGMLYFATEGYADSWQVDDHWMTDTDPCDSWTGVVCNPPRSGGSCAVTSLELSSNNLRGYLPREFCCMPCLQHIEMANNAIGGDILTCLVDIGTLQTVDFVNNKFGTAPVPP